jgi:hypothetical protein
MVKNKEWLVIYADPDSDIQVILGTIRGNEPFMFIRSGNSVGAARHWLYVGFQDQFGYIAVHHTTQFQEVRDA